MPSIGVDLDLHLPENFWKQQVSESTTWVEDASLFFGKVRTASKRQSWMTSRLVFLGAVSSAV